MRVPRTGRVAAGMLGLLALVFCAASWKLGYWVKGAPGPGLLPLGAALLLLLCVTFLVRAPPASDEDPGFGRAPLGAFALLCAYGLAVPWGGIVIPSVIFGALWMRLLHQRPLIASFVIAALVCGAGATLFKLMLKIPLPLWPALA